MSTIYTPPGGYVVNLSAAQAGNGASTNVAQRRALADVAARAAVLRIVAATGTACTYLIEGSPDGAVFWPVPSGDLATAGAFSLVAGAITIAAPATLWRLIPVDLPWTFLRITYSANTAMVNTADLWAY